MEHQKHVVLNLKTGWKIFYFTAASVCILTLSLLIRELLPLLDFAGLQGLLLFSFLAGIIVLQLYLMLYVINHSIIVDHEGVQREGILRRKLYAYKDLQKIHFHKGIRWNESITAFLTKKYIVLDSRYTNLPSAIQFVDELAPDVEVVLNSHKKMRSK